MKTVEYKNLSADEIIRTLKVDNVNLVSTNDSEATFFDKVNKVKIVITTENNVTIVKFYYLWIAKYIATDKKTHIGNLV